MEPERDRPDYGRSAHLITVPPDDVTWKVIREAIVAELIERFSPAGSASGGVVLSESEANSIAIAALCRVRHRSSS